MHRTLKIEFETPVHHGNGYGMAGIVDRPFLQDSQRTPYLSGAAIKGKFRFAALRLASTLELPGGVCEQRAGSFCRAKRCVLCRMFGSPWQEGALLFSDAYPVERELLAQLQGGDTRRARGSSVRSNTAIDRKLRTVKRQHLFTTETVPALKFQAAIEGKLEPSDEELLVQCALVLTHFGADSSRGLGQCRYMLERGDLP